MHSLLFYDSYICCQVNYRQKLLTNQFLIVKMSNSAFNTSFLYTAFLFVSGLLHLKLGTSKNLCRLNVLRILLVDCAKFSQTYWRISRKFCAI